MDQDKVKSMLKKLFAVAENDASADGEIANALASARNLMSAHQIERDDVVGNIESRRVTGQAEVNFTPRGTRSMKFQGPGANRSRRTAGQQGIVTAIQSPKILLRPGFDF